jgi:mRNA interferase RelE/StbE
MSRYTVYVVPRAWREMKDLPGNVRHRVKRAVDRLADNPCPARSRRLDASELESSL